MKYEQPSFNVGGASGSYDEGYDRTFGKREPVKGKRWVYRTNEEGKVEVIEVSSDYEAYDARQPVFTDRYMEGVSTVDGVDISSRTKRREYMKSEGLVDADDFKNTWAKAKDEREKFFRGEKKDPRLKEAIRRAFEQPRRRK
jgi:hypothetical protein